MDNKTKPARTSAAKRKPKGRAMWMRSIHSIETHIFAGGSILVSCTNTTARDGSKSRPVVVIECATVREARAIVRLHAMSEDALQVLVTKTLARNSSLDNDEPMRAAAAVLAALGLKGRT